MPDINLPSVRCEYRKTYGGIRYVRFIKKALTHGTSDLKVYRFLRGKDGRKHPGEHLGDKDQRDAVQAFRYRSYRSRKQDRSFYLDRIFGRSSHQFYKHEEVSDRLIVTKYIHLKRLALFRSGVFDVIIFLLREA